MSIKKERNILIVLVIISIFLGFLITFSRHATVQNKPQQDWYQITSESSPAFYLEMPGSPKHIINEVQIESFEKLFKTATIQSDFNNVNYLLVITDYGEEIKKFPRKDLFQKNLDLLKSGNSKMLTSLTYAPSNLDIDDFQITDSQGIGNIRGKMFIKDQYLFLLMMTFDEGKFPEGNYRKFIDSLK